MNFLKTALTVAAIATAPLSATAAQATETIFVPPSDPIGVVSSTNVNDGYGDGRGVVFTPTADIILTDVALYQNLTNVILNYSLSLATNSTGSVGGGAVLQSGSTMANTSGLEFINFSLTPTTLNAGTYYFLDFNFQGTSNENFFYNQLEPQPYGQAGFSGIDGTAFGDTTNFVIPRIRLTTISAVTAVPEPSTWAMMLLGLGATGVAIRRRRRSNTRAMQIA